MSDESTIKIVGIRQRCNGETTTCLTNFMTMQHQLEYFTGPMHCVTGAADRIHDGSDFSQTCGTASQQSMNVIFTLSTRDMGKIFQEKFGLSDWVQTADIATCSLLRSPACFSQLKQLPLARDTRELCLDMRAEQEHNIIWHHSFCFFFREEEKKR